MVTPSDITGFLDNKWFNSLAGLGDWVFNIMFSLFILLSVYVIWQMLEHKIKIIYFPIFGTDTSKIDKDTSMAELENLKVQLGHPKKARGRDFKQKGVNKFSLMLFPNIFKSKKIPPVNYNSRYVDGIWFLRPNKDTFIPIKRPALDGAVKLKVPEPDMDLWQQVEEENIRRRTQDEDMTKRHLMMTAGIIVGAFVLAGVIIWLSMSFAGNSLSQVMDKVSPMTTALEKLASGGTAPG